MHDTDSKCKTFPNHLHINFAVRPRKKVKQPLAQSAKSSKSKSKKQSPPSGRNIRQKSGPNFPADIDELVKNLHPNTHTS